MSDLEDLETIAEQHRYGGNEQYLGMSKRKRMSLHSAQQRGVAANRSVSKQQDRSGDRRGSLVNRENQD